MKADNEVSGLPFLHDLDTEHERQQEVDLEHSFAWLDPIFVAADAVERALPLVARAVTIIRPPVRVVHPITGETLGYLDADFPVADRWPIPHPFIRDSARFGGIKDKPRIADALEIENEGDRKSTVVGRGTGCGYRIQLERILNSRNVRWTIWTATWIEWWLESK